jgi:hypothetical protein
VIQWIINGERVTEEEYAAHCKKNSKRYRDNLRDILDSRKPPALAGDDTTFFNAFGTLYDQLGDQADMVVEEAKRQGYTPSGNDIYMGSVARGIGDPEAFFHAGRGRAEYKRTIEDNFGTASSGRWVETKNIDRPPPENITLADDIVEDIYRERMLIDPEILRRNKADVKAEIIEDHGARKRV